MMVGVSSRDATKRSDLEYLKIIRYSQNLLNRCGD